MHLTTYVCSSWFDVFARKKGPTRWHVPFAPNWNLKKLWVRTSANIPELYQISEIVRKIIEIFKLIAKSFWFCTYFFSISSIFLSYSWNLILFRSMDTSPYVCFLWLQKGIAVKLLLNKFSACLRRLNGGIRCLFQKKSSTWE